MHPITDQEKLDLLTIINHPDIVLMKVWFGEEETAAICLRNTEEEENKVTITPMAVLVTEGMFAMMQPPDDPFGGGNEPTN